MISAFVDTYQSDKTVTDLIRLLGLEEHGKELVAVLVLKGRHTLTKTILTKSNQPYDPVFTVIALENDFIDIVYLL